MARISGFCAGITEHTLSSFRRRARARAPPRAPKRGRHVYFYYYYYFITILLSFKFTALTPEKKYTHGTYTYIIILPTYTHHVLSNRPRHNRETPSLRTIVSTQTQILLRQWSGVRVMLKYYYIYNYVHLNLTYCRQITRAARYILVLLTDAMPPGRRRRS